MMAQFVVVNGETIRLGQNEALEEIPCPECGGQMITNYGHGMSETYCTKCDHLEYDYE